MILMESQEFNIGDAVVYPKHGVGVIDKEEVDKYGGYKVSVFVISFKSSNMILRIPKSRIGKLGLRHISSSELLDKAMDILSGKQIKLCRGMWSKRVQYYENKINSGDVSAIAEVVKELHQNVDKAGRSYSEKAIYDSAFDRLAREYAEAHNKKLNEAIDYISGTLE